MMNLDFAETARRAMLMSSDSLRFAINDCREAGICALEMERSHGGLGYNAKSQGYYSDEASVYLAELKRREKTLTT